MIGLLERAAGLRREDPPTAQLDRLETMLALAVDDPGEAVPVLADLLGVPAGDRYPPPDPSPQQRKERTFQVLLDQLAGLAAKGPVLALYEDVHWADPTTLELLGRVLERAQRLSALVLVTFRPEFAPPWGGHGHVTLLSLGRLGRRQGAAVVERVTGGKALPAGVLGTILDRTDGVPLFVEELTKTVLESGLLREEGGGYALAGPLPPLAIPSTLQDSLVARLDRLAPVKEVAQVAACIGREFPLALLAEVAGVPDAALGPALGQLVAAELIFRRGGQPDETYTFKHALVRDATYQSLLKSRRQQLHARIVDALERRFPEVVARSPEVVAMHCAEAGLVDAACGYWTAAGLRAIARSAVAEARDQLARGLELVRALPDDGARRRRELALVVAMGQALIPASGYAASETQAAYLRARELSDAVGDTEHRAAILYGQYVCHFVRAELAAALAVAEEMLRHGADHGDATVQVIGHRSLGSLTFQFRHFAAAQRHCRAGLALYDPDRDRAHIARFAIDSRLICLSWLAKATAIMGDVGEARAHVEAMLSSTLAICRRKPLQNKGLTLRARFR